MKDFLSKVSIGRKGIRKFKPSLAYTAENVYPVVLLPCFFSVYIFFKFYVFVIVTLLIFNYLEENIHISNEDVEEYKPYI